MVTDIVRFNAIFIKLSLISVRQSDRSKVSFLTGPFAPIFSKQNKHQLMNDDDLNYTFIK